MARPSVGFDLYWMSLTLKPRMIWCLRRRACHLSWNYNKEDGPPFPGSGSFRAIWPLQFTEDRPPPGPEAFTHNLTSLSPAPGLPAHLGAWRACVYVCVCVCVCVCMCVWAHMCAQLCPTLCNPMDYNLPDSFVYGIFQARILEWVVISFSRRSQPRDWTHVSRVSCIGRQILYHCTTWEALY